MAAQSRAANAACTRSIAAVAAFGFARAASGVGDVQAGGPHHKIWVGSIVVRASRLHR